MSHEHLAPASRVVALGRQDRMPGAGVNAPLELSSTYVADGPVNYARGGNPTWSAFEEALGALEGGDALVFASGMAAVTAALSLAGHGDVVVAPRAAYNGTVASLLDAERDGRFEVRWVDPTDVDATVTAMDGADLVWLESPSNPLLEVSDLAALAAAARERGVISVCDNTFATPLVQQPLSAGDRRRGALGHEVPQRPQRRDPGRHGDDGRTSGAGRCTSACPGPGCSAGPSPARWRPGSRCAACAPSMCASSGPPRTPRSWRRA